MKENCRLLAVLSLALGVLGGGYLACNIVRDSLPAAVLAFICLFIPAFILYMILKTLAEVLENQEAIRLQMDQIQNKLKNSRFAVDGQQKPARDGSVPAGGWICPACGAVNPGYVGTCGCSEQKPR